MAVSALLSHFNYKIPICTRCLKTLYFSQIGLYIVAFWAQNPHEAYTIGLHEGFCRSPPLYYVIVGDSLIQLDAGFFISVNSSRCQAA